MFPIEHEEARRYVNEAVPDSVCRVVKLDYGGSPSSNLWNTSSEGILVDISVYIAKRMADDILIIIQYH